MTPLLIFRAVLLLAFFVIAVRYLQDSVLFRPELPPRDPRRKWLLAGLTALLLGLLDVGGTALVLGLIGLSPLSALLVVKPLFWALGALPFVWLFKVSFFTGLKASAWAVLIAVLGELVTRMVVFLFGGALLGRPVAMAIGLGVLGVLVGVALLVRRRQAKRLVALAEGELSEDERAKLAQEMVGPDAEISGEAAASVAQQAYCPSCGAAASLGAQRCPSCGGMMDQLELDMLERRPLEYRWLGLFVGGTALLIALVSLIPLVNLLFVGMRFPSESLLAFSAASHRLPVTVTGGFLGVFAFLLLFAIAGVTLGALAKRPIYRELAVGSVALSVVTWLIWAARAGGNAGMLVANPMNLVAFSGEALLAGPLPVFLLGINVFGALSALGGARIGVVLAERMTGETSCYRCGDVRPLEPAIPACRRCGAPVKRSTTDWRWVAPVVGATLLCFVLVTRLAGPSLGLYWKCDFAKPSAACAEVGRSFYRHSSSLSAFRGARGLDGSRPAVILHPAKYIGLLAPLFLLGPLLISWRRRHARSAGVAVALNAAGSLLAALLVLGFALGGRAFSGALQIQLLAVLAWSAAGGLGVALGNKLRRGDPGDFAELLAQAGIADAGPEPEPERRPRHHEPEVARVHR